MVKGARNLRRTPRRDRSAAPERPARAIGWDRWDLVLSVGWVLAGCVVLLPNVGDRCLWQDEAECALVASNILRTGLPMAWDGRLLVASVHGMEFTDTLLWSWHPWAMHYVTAAGMALFGKTAFGARLPFALLGCVSIGLTYVVARRLVRDRWASCVAAVLLISSVQYLLLMRQCRYYAIVPVAALLGVWGYTDLPRRRGVIALIAGAVLLFHANYMTCTCFGLGLAAHALLWRPDRRTLSRLGIASLATALLTLPWFFGMGLHDLLGRSQTVGFERDTFGLGVLRLVFMMNRFVCPIVVAVGLIIVAARGRLRVDGAYRLAACMTVPVVILVPMFLWANPRYLVHMLPLGSIVVAAALREVHLRNHVAGSFGAIVAAVTNLLPVLACALFPGSVGTSRLDGEFVTGAGVIGQAMLKTEWAGYVHELREPFVGPNKAITRFLNEHSEPNDIIYAPYGQFPIMFHTNRRCAGLLKAPSRSRPGWDQLPEYLWDADTANWLIPRRRWLPGGEYQATIRRWQDRARRSGRRLAVHKLPIRDIGWGNRPLLQYHPFQSPGPSRTRNITLICMQRPDRPRPSKLGVPQRDRRENVGR